MEAAPPTYEKATLVDYWDIIARYIPSNDLCSAALVCSRWHSTFTPHLWGNPASHFGIENDRVYVALTRFKRTLQTARLLVRSLTHTVHLPPAHAEIYNGPHADWLRDILDRLPNLQSLIVRGLPFFDHSALHVLKYKRPKPEGDDNVPDGVIELPASSGFAFQRPADFIPSFGLRLLDASRCPNVTSSSLAQALGRFEGLLYLDLSFTYPARDPVVLNTLRRFTGLQVLKLRGTGLSDDSLGVLGTAIARRVRSLDIRDNHIGDRGVRTLLDECFILTGSNNNSADPGQRSPALLPYMGAEMLDIYQDEDFESFIRNAFTGRFVGRLAIEDAPEGGITHLYISGNELTVEGVSGLVRSGRLHVLDVEPVMYGIERHLSSASYDSTDSTLAMPGAEKLTPVMAKFAATSMTFLRIDHSLITKDAPRVDPFEEVIQGRVELADNGLPDLPRNVAELGGSQVRPDAFELPTVQTPKYELPGDPMQFVVSPATNDHQHGDEEDDPLFNGPRRGSAFAPECVDGSRRGSAFAPECVDGPRRGSDFAPEVVDTLSTEADRMNLLSPVSALEEGTLMNGAWMNGRAILTPISEPSSPAPWQSGVGSEERPTTHHRHHRSYSSVANERTARLNAHRSAKHNLHPAMLPRLRTLIITDVPSFSSSKDISDRLICFIRQCAEESWLAKSQAKLDYALPPGRKGHATALKHSADKIFALRRLVLELSPQEGTRRGSKASPWQHVLSTTGDRDSEAFWSASDADFTFFGEEDYGFPSLDSGRFAHPFRSDGKEVSFGDGWGSPTTPKQPAAPRFDTVALLSAFRKERKQAHQRNIAAGSSDPETEGYWDGIVQVVRPGSGLRNDEEVDYYGNRFENGFLYR